MIKNNKTEEITEYKACGVFYAIGHEPCTYFIKNSNINLDMDKDGYIITENDSTKTNIPGIFCAGDVRGCACVFPRCAHRIEWGRSDRK